MGRWRRIVRAEETFSFLPDAEKLRFRGPWEIDRWLWDVKDAFCDAEDLLEEWNLEVMQLREWPSKDEKLNQVISSSSSPSEKPDLSLEMSARAKKIRERIEAIAAEGRDLGLRECAEDVRVERRERLDSFVYDDDIIGREDDKSAIMNFLLDSDTDERISFFIIGGQSGIGKPALDRCLYEDDKVKKHFDVRIWVYFILPGDDSCRESYGGLRELNRLNSLRGSLRIEVKGKIKDAVAESNGSNLKEKNSLVSLVLVFVGKERDEVLLKELQPSLNLQSLEPRGYGGAMFPSWMSRMPKLVQLRLFDCARCKSLPSLGELTSLKHLEIGELSITEYTESDIHTLSSLPNLSTLRIWECPNLNGFHNLYNSRSWDLLVCLWRPL
ncbi:uncharacterized protein LOC120293948 [Eucalyptus grandis]|uniref:uncharacterized protein LOC120293948 n=1 Tax=Eucalyptus grandis TaxID=71139 RepID=UPI00192EFF8D|nr:uncharacterized protein LOC120293948 [Eucalyptus grandis]